MGYILALWLFPVMIILVIALGTSGHSSERFDIWLDRCKLDGGQAVLDRQEAFNNHYECYKDNKIINHVED